MTAHPFQPDNASLRAPGLLRTNCFEIAFAVSPAAQLVVESGKHCVVEANPAALRLLGLSGRELIGLEFPQLFTENDAARAALGAASGSAPLVALHLRRGDGFIVAVDVLSTPCRLIGAKSGFLVQLQAAAPSPAGAVPPAKPDFEEGVPHDLVERIGDGFLLLNTEGVVTFANESAARILGLAQGDLTGRRFSDLFPRLSHDDLLRTVQTARPEAALNPIRIPLFFGCELRHFEFGVHSCPEGLGILFRDVGENLKQEMEIAKLNATMAISQELLRSKNEELNASLEKLARLNEQLENADRLKSEFLANTSHELRTPLNSTIGFLQLICEGLCENRDEELEYVHNALSASQHLLSLINDVLDIAKIEAGKMTLLIDDIDLDNMFHEVFVMTHVQAQQKGLKLTFDVKDPDQRMLRADFHKVKQVLVNLIGNAIKFTHTGGIEVWAEPSPDRPDQMLICVQDTGIGIAPYQQQTIFDKFTQADGTSTRKYQGTGLGLAISRNLVEMMGGTISLYSKGENKGTTMRFTLPKGNGLRRPSDPAAPGEIDLDDALPKTF